MSESIVGAISALVGVAVGQCAYHLWLLNKDRAEDRRNGMDIPYPWYLWFLKGWRDDGNA